MSTEEHKTQSPPASLPLVPAWLIGLMAVALIVTVLHFAKPVLLPLAIACLLAFLLTPAVRRLELFRVQRVVGVLVVMCMVTVGIALLGWVIQRQARELAEQLPTYRVNIEQKLASLSSLKDTALGRTGATLSHLGERLAGSVDATTDQQPAASVITPTTVVIAEKPTSAVTLVWTALLPLVSPFATAIIVIVLTAFILMKREDLRSRVVRLVGKRRITDVTEAMDDAGNRVSRFLVVFTAINGSVGLVIAIALFLIGVPNAALWGLLIFVLRFVPYVGVWLGALLPAALAVATSPGWTAVLLVVGCILVVELVATNFVEPLLLGSGTGISSLSLLVATIFWTWLWGPVGLLLATPLTVCVVVIARHVPRLAFLDVMLSDERPLAPEVELYQRLLAEDGAEANKLVKTYSDKHSLEEVYDTLILPALGLSEIDRHRGALDEDRLRAVHETARAGIEDLRLRNAEIDAQPGIMICCVPARDAADELAASMLVNLLRANGMDARVLSAETFVGEAVEKVAANVPTVVCVSALPPHALLHARTMCKKLRSKVLGIPIVVGLWGASSDERYEIVELQRAGATSVAVSLGEAARMIRSRTMLHVTGAISSLPQMLVPLPSDHKQAQIG